MQNAGTALVSRDPGVPAFCTHFSRPERTRMSDRQGTDARRDATSGQIVCFQGPGAAALDRESSSYSLNHSAMMRAGPLARVAEAERPVPAVGRSPLGRLAIRGARGRRDPLPLGIDVAAPL